MTLHYKTARIALAAGALLALSACANLAQVAPGTPLADVQAQFGRPNFECPQANGGRRVIWTQQPMGQYAWGANVGADGRVDKVLPLLTDPHFKVLETGTWSPDRVRCEFGPPARIDEAGLGEKREVVWSYRYKENSVWNSLMYVYMGRDGSGVTHFHPGRIRCTTKTGSCGAECLGHEKPAQRRVFQCIPAMMSRPCPRRSCCKRRARFQRSAQMIQPDRPYSTNRPNSTTGGSLETNTNTATTSRMPQNGTLRPRAKLLPLKNGAFDTIEMPAYMVTVNATQAITLSWMGSLLSTASQTKPATSAAAAGLGRPWK